MTRTSSPFRTGVVLLASVLSLSAYATVLRAVDLETLAKSADSIVRGTATATTAAYTEDGKQIHSITTVRVATALKGAPPAEIEVRTPGGTIGDITQRVYGAAQFRPGQEVILFLHRVGDRRFTLEGFSQGKFDVVRAPDGGVHVTQDLREVGVLGPDGVVRPGAVLTPVPERDFLSRVRKALEGTVTP